MYDSVDNSGSFDASDNNSYSKQPAIDAVKSFGGPTYPPNNRRNLQSAFPGKKQQNSQNTESLPRLPIRASSSMVMNKNKSM